MNYSLEGPPVYSGSAETDVILEQGSMPGAGVIGYVYCDDPIDRTDKCDQHYIIYKYYHANDVDDIFPCATSLVTRLLWYMGIKLPRMWVFMPLMAWDAWRMVPPRNIWGRTTAKS